MARLGTRYHENDLPPADHSNQIMHLIRYGYDRSPVKIHIHGAFGTFDLEGLHPQTPSG